MREIKFRAWRADALKPIEDFNDEYIELTATLIKQEK